MLMNLDRTRDILAERGLDAVVATSPENVTYSSGYTSWTIYTFKDLEVYAVIPRDGTSALIVPIDALDYLAQRPGWVSDIYTYGTYNTVYNPDVALTGTEATLWELRERSSHHQTARSALAQALADRGLQGGTVGVDERGLPPQRWDLLVADLAGTHIVEASEVFREARIIKTEDEIDLLQYAARSVEAGIEAMFEDAVPGATEADLETRFRTVVASTGTTPGHFETSSGTRGAGCFPASGEYRIQLGDVIRSDCGGRYVGYWADTGRTAAVGTPPASLERYYHAIKQGTEAMLAAIRPGLPVAELFRIGVETVQAAGIPHYKRHHVGHGIGLDMYEAPLLVGSGGSTDIHAIGPTDTKLEAGMVINIELPYYELGLGGLQIEETLVVRSSGPELLTKASREMFHSVPVAT